MDVIQVPAVPKEAFNKHRRISDLIRAQVKHLKHLEEKLPAEKRTSLPQHAIVTENDASIYIAAMTRLLCSGAGEAEAPVARKGRVVPIRPAATVEVAAPLELAAAGEESKPKGRAKKGAKPGGAKKSAKEAKSRGPR